MKNTIYVSITLLLAMLYSCSNSSVNTDQVNSTLQNLQCYQDLIDEITKTQDITNKIIEIRQSKKSGKEDPVTVKQSFRTIDNHELENILTDLWKDNCLDKMNQVNDLTGIRFIDKNTIVIEIDKFKSRNLSEQYSSGSTTEIHRLIVADEYPKGEFYKFGTEQIVWTKDLGEKWTYEVSQYHIVY